MFFQLVCGDIMSDKDDEKSYELDELSVDKVAEIAGISKEKAEENLETLRGVLQKPEEISDEDKELAHEMMESAIQSDETFETARSVVGSILSTQKGAKTSGEITGSTLSTIVEEVPRIADGNAGMGEVKKIGTAIASIIDGYKEGKDISRHVIENLPSREELDKRRNSIDVEEVDSSEDEEDNDS